MQYKGDDLDLRVPHGRPARDPYMADYEPAPGNGRWSRAPAFGAGPGEPLWVDEVLLACCNYAFDVAQANGSAEVSLEHLVNALTRVDAAARVLEARGVREGQLRRDSAALIASEIPAANAGEAASPRRSADLEDALRRASDIAQRRAAAAGVEDMLWVLLHFPRELPVLLLLRRLSPDWQRADWSRTRDYAVPEPQPTPPPRPVQLLASDGLNARLASLEDTMRYIQGEMASERKLLMDLVRDIQRDVVAQRSDGAAFRGDLGQRLEIIERSLQTRGDGNRAVTLVADRMSALEKAVHSGLGEGARNWANLGQRLASFEGALAERPGGHPIEPLAERIAALERSIEGYARTNEASRAAADKTRTSLAERLQLIEGHLTTAGGAPDEQVKELSDRLGGLERAVRAGFGDAVATTGQVVERIIAIERSITQQPRDHGEALLILDERLGTIERMLDQRGQQTVSATAEVIDRLRLLEQRPASQTAVDVDALMAPMHGRFEGIARQSAERETALQGALAGIATRLGALEERMRSEAAVTEEALRGRDQDFDFIYGEIKQLGQSQATLNSAVSDWRTESQEHFGALAGRLDKLQPVVDEPVLPAPARDMPNVVNAKSVEQDDVELETVRPTAADRRGPSAINAQDYKLPPQPSRGFWYWLFGTESLRRANRENDLQVTRMRQNIREARDRRRTQA